MMSGEDPNYCDRSPRRNEALLSQAGFDDIERACLDIARLFFSTFSNPHSQNWMRAIEFAEYAFDHKQGATVAALIMKVIQAIRCSRTSNFTFSNPDCPGCARILTEHERRLVIAIGATRRKRRERAQVEMMMLCEGNETEQVLVWLGELALALPKPARVLLAG